MLSFMNGSQKAALLRGEEVVRVKELSIFFFLISDFEKIQVRSMKIYFLCILCFVLRLSIYSLSLLI